MLDIAVAYNRYKFLGNEFLTWLWFIIENDQTILKKNDQEFISIEIGNKIVFENKKKDSTEKITIKGDDAGLEEGVLALKKGAVVTELNILYNTGGNKWQYTLKGESLNLSTLKTPETARVETEEDVEGAVLEKVFLTEKVVEFVEGLFKEFVKLRVSEKWDNNVVREIKTWIGA